jgi:hypothetical protein
MPKIQYKDPVKYIITAYSQDLGIIVIMGYVNTKEEAEALIGKIASGHNPELIYYKENYSRWDYDEAHKIILK